MSMSFTRRSGPAPSTLASQLRANLTTAQRATEQDILATAKRLVHKRTRRTEGSLEVQMQGPLTGRIVGRYGAYWLEQRGGDYAFADRALAEVKPRAGGRVQDAMEAAKHGG